LFLTFADLGIRGEIGLDRTEADYDKWGIQIKVAFRDNEKVQILTSHRQSGGERALTTVMYVMSLAELAKAPFALVALKPVGGYSSWAGASIDAGGVKCALAAGWSVTRIFAARERSDHSVGAWAGDPRPDRRARASQKPDSTKPTSTPHPQLTLDPSIPLAAQLTNPSLNGHPVRLADRGQVRARHGPRASDPDPTRVRR